MDIFAALAEIEREKAIPERRIDFRSPEWRKVAGVVMASEEHVYKLKLSIAREFGIQHGWRLSTYFSLGCLVMGKVYDIDNHRGRTYDTNKYVANEICGSCSILPSE